MSDTSGNPVEATVTAYTGSAFGTAAGSTGAGANGTYVLTLPPGNYRVCFTGPAGGQWPVGGYQLQCYDNAPWVGPPFLAGTLVTVTAGTADTSIDAVLTEAGAISGTVTDARGDPIAGVLAYAIPDSTLTNVGPTATTGTDGDYTMTDVTPGTYAVCFSTIDVSVAYSDQCYSDLPWSGGSLSAAGNTLITVGAGAVTGGINATLVSGGMVFGRVTDSSGQPVQGVSVEAFSDASPSEEVASTQTGADGSYGISGLATGFYFVCFDADVLGPTSGAGYLDQCYSDVPYNAAGFAPPSSAAPVSVTAGVLTPDIDAQLQPGGAVSGTVTGVDGAPLASGEVEAFTTGANPQLMAQSALGANGGYLLRGLPAGDYDVCFTGDNIPGPSDPTSYAGQCYNESGNVAWDSQQADVSGASPIQVIIGSVVPNINAQLTLAAGISGTVTNAGGAELQNVVVNVYTAGAQRLGVGVTWTDDQGNYSFTGLLPGQYYVCFQIAVITEPAGSSGSGCWAGAGQSLTLAGVPVAAQSGSFTQDINVKWAN